MKRMHNMEFKSKIVKVELIHNEMVDRRWPEIRLDNSMTVAELKNKLYSKTGTKSSDMVLYAYNPSDLSSTQIELNDDSLPLYMYDVDSGYVIFIKTCDTTRNGSINSTKSADTIQKDLYPKSLLQNDDSSKLKDHYIRQMNICNELGTDVAFERYRMSDEDYESRGRELREFIQKMRQKNKSVSAPNESHSEASNENKEKTLSEIMSLYPIDSRCMVFPGDRRGRIKFVGNVSRGPKENIKIGVELDEPFGDCDGIFNNVRYFSCVGRNYGGFFDPNNIEVGDFPEIDPFDF